ncbi:MAG: SBBP repeat-containing protein [Bacteroidetes bacterium]|nr:SBBP repeat-containing protein [Bacteroidota bacterium]
MKKIILFVNYVVCLNFTYAQEPNFEWAKGVGGADFDSGRSIITDSVGNVYTTGNFQGTIDFDPGVGVFTLTSTSTSSFSSTGDVFILKLNAFGDFLWAKQLVGTGNINAQSITIDINGNIFITGNFNGTVDFDPGIGIYNLWADSTSANDVFILKLDVFGNFIWGKQMVATYGSSGIGTSIRTDFSGNVYTIGDFSGTVDFDPGAGVFDLTTVSFYNNIFISKVDSFGNFLWAKQLTGTVGTFENGTCITIDSIGNLYAVGCFSGTVDFDTDAGSFDLSSVGSQNNMFILKLNTSGNFIWVKTMQGSGSPYSVGWSIASDAMGNIYSTGQFGGTIDFDPGAGVVNLTSVSSGDAFILKLDSTGNFVWVKNIGGAGFAYYVYGYSIALDLMSNVYTTGYFHGTVDFNPGSGTDSLTAESDDLFISKLDASGNFVWAVNMGGASGFTRGYSIAIDLSDNVFTTGYFYGMADFDSGTGIVYLTSAGNTDFFVQKLSQPPTGINEATNSNDISIYPNPNNGTFNISFASQIKNASIEVYNSLGSLVYKEEIANQENSIELSNQANGLYFVKVMSENEIVGIRKVVKE